MFSGKNSVERKTKHISFYRRPREDNITGFSQRAEQAIVYFLLFFQGTRKELTPKISPVFQLATHFILVTPHRKTVIYRFRKLISLNKTEPLFLVPLIPRCLQAFQNKKTAPLGITYCESYLCPLQI